MLKAEKELLSLTEGMNDQSKALAASFATAIAVPLVAKSIANKAGGMGGVTKKRRDAYDTLKSMGLKNPTDRDVDDYLIHRAGRQTRAEEEQAKFDMPDTKKSRAGNLAAAGSVIGAIGAGVAATRQAVTKAGGGEMLLTSIPPHALSSVRRIPTAIAAGSVVGGVAGAYFGTRLWNAQKAAKDAQRPNRKSEAEAPVSKFVEAYQGEKERISEGFADKAVGFAKKAYSAAAPHASEFAKGAKVAVDAAKDGVKSIAKDVVTHKKKVGAVLGTALAVDAVNAHNGKKKEKETMDNGGDLNKDAKGMGKRDGDGDGKLNESLGEGFEYLESLLSEGVNQKQIDQVRAAATVGVAAGTAARKKVLGPSKPKTEGCESDDDSLSEGLKDLGKKMIDKVDNSKAGHAVAGALGSAAGSAINFGMDHPKVAKGLVAGTAGIGMLGAAALAHRAMKSLRDNGKGDPSDEELYNEMRSHNDRYTNGGDLNKNAQGMGKGGKMIKPPAPPGKVWRFGKLVDESDE